MSSASSTSSTPSSSPQQGGGGVGSGGGGSPGGGDFFAVASAAAVTASPQTALRRSSLTNPTSSPVLSPLGSTTGSSLSVQKLKRMFSEPEQRAQQPPLSPKPALKAKPVTLMKLGKRSNPIVAPRASLPEAKLSAETIERGSSLQSGHITTMPKDAFAAAAVATVNGPIREYKQTSC